MEEIYQEIQNLELELASPKARENLSRLSKLLADDFEEFGSSGKIFNKKNILEICPRHKDITYQLSDFSFKSLSESCVLVKYRTLVNEQKALRSSIWVNVGGSWKILHHQSTVINNVT